MAARIMARNLAVGGMMVAFIKGFLVGMVGGGGRLGKGDVGDVVEEGGVGKEEEGIEPDGVVGVLSGEFAGLGVQALDLGGVEGKVGFTASGAGFDFDHEDEVVFGEEEVGLGEGVFGPRERAIAVEAKIKAGDDFGRFAFGVGVEAVPPCKFGVGLVLGKVLIGR